MKKLFSILLIAQVITFTTHPMEQMLASLPGIQQMITSFSMQYIEYCHDYFKTCDIGKTLLIGAVGILVLDKIFPIFPVRTKVVWPSETFNQTEITQKINNGVAKGISDFCESTFNPTIENLTKRMNDAPAQGAKKEKKPESLKDTLYLKNLLQDTKNDLKALRENHESLERRLKKHEDALVSYVDAQKTLDIFNLQLAEFQKRADSIQSYLEVLGQQGKDISSPRANYWSSDDDCKRSSADLGFILEEVEEEENDDDDDNTYVAPSFKPKVGSKLKLGGSGTLKKGKDVEQESPRTNEKPPTDEVPYCYHT